RRDRARRSSTPGPLPPRPAHAVERRRADVGRRQGVGVQLDGDKASAVLADPADASVAGTGPGRGQSGVEDLGAPVDRMSRGMFSGSSARTCYPTAQLDAGCSRVRPMTQSSPANNRCKAFEGIGDLSGLYVNGALLVREATAP